MYLCPRWQSKHQTIDGQGQTIPVKTLGRLWSESEMRAAAPDLTFVLPNFKQAGWMEIPSPWLIILITLSLNIAIFFHQKISSKNGKLSNYSFWLQDTVNSLFLLFLSSPPPRRWQNNGHAKPLIRNTCQGNSPRCSSLLDHAVKNGNVHWTDWIPWARPSFRKQRSYPGQQQNANPLPETCCFSMNWMTHHWRVTQRFRGYWLLFPCDDSLRIEATALHL